MKSILLFIMLLIATTLLSKTKEYYIVDYAPKVLGRQPINIGIVENDSVTVVQFIIYSNKKEITRVEKMNNSRTYTYEKKEEYIYVPSLQIDYLNSKAFKDSHENLNRVYKQRFLLLHEEFYSLSNKDKYELLLNKSKKQ